MNYFEHALVIYFSQQVSRIRIGRVVFTQNVAPGGSLQVEPIELPGSLEYVSTFDIKRVI